MRERMHGPITEQVHGMVDRQLVSIERSKGNHPGWRTDYEWLEDRRDNCYRQTQVSVMHAPEQVARWAWCAEALDWLFNAALNDAISEHRCLNFVKEATP